MAVGSWPKGMIEDAYGWLWQAYNEVEGKVDTLFDIKNPTEGMYDQQTTGIAMGSLEKMTAYDATPTFRRPSEGFTAYSAYREFKDGISLGRLEVERFPKSKARNIMEDAVRSWGATLKRTEENFGSELFRLGGKTAGDTAFGNVIPGLLSQNTDNLAYDAKPFFNRSNNTRTSKGGGTYYNAVNTVLNVANYGELHDLIFVTNAKDERDENIDTAAMGQMVLLVPPQLRDDAFTAVEDEILAGATNDQKNPWKGTSKPVVWRYIAANANTWYLGVAKKGIRFYRAGKPEIAPSRDPKSGAYEAYIAALMGWMAFDWRFWGGSQVPTS